MNITKIIENFEEIAKYAEGMSKGFTMLAELLKEEVDAPKTAPKAEKPKQAAKKAEEKPVEKSVEKPVEKADAPKPEYTVEVLSKLKYSEFKKLAASLGVDCKGTRAEIMERLNESHAITLVDALDYDENGNKIKAKPSIVVEGTEEETVDTPKPSKSKSGKSTGVGRPKASKPDGEGVRDEFDEQADRIATETPVEEIIDVLKDVGIKATKLNYKKKLAQALREELIATEESDGYEEDEELESMIEEFEREQEEIEGEEGVECIDPKKYYAAYDIYKVNDFDKMTEERKKACLDRQATILKSILEDDTLTVEEAVDFLHDVASQEEFDMIGDDYNDADLVKLYIETYKRLIDDDGNSHEPGDAYLINDVPYCCGRPLEYDEETDKFVCSTCTSTYDAE